MITRAQLDEFFASLHARGVDMNRPMLWSFFFTGHDKRPLHRARRALEELGYEWIGLLGPDARNDDKRLMFLQVDKVELHTATTLWTRCEALYRFASENALETFDGFDVGNPDGSPLY